MAVIVVREAEAIVTGDGAAAIRLVYDLPGGPRSQGSRVEHEHVVPVAAVWLRMVRLGISKAEALEDCVLGIVAADVLGAYPADPVERNRARATARARHDVATVRRFVDLVPDPTAEQALAMQPRRVRRSQP